MKNAIHPTRSQDYPNWYQAVIQAAELADHAPVRGCMLIRPNGYAIWERMQYILDQQFKAIGIQNVYFPLLIPLSFFNQEAEHIEGFAKECAVVTHHRLKVTDAGLVPDGLLEEPYVIRPTSETLFGAQLAKWIQSHRDLPIRLNQWVNVMRWEKRTRLFLRSSEFLWQEGHTAYATAQEAAQDAAHMITLYERFLSDYLAISVIKGEKTPAERFPGAVHTWTVEAMMQDGKALQAGTSHALGQNFSKSFGMRFTNAQGELEHCWTSSWGVSTRLIGALIMSHSDDDGLVLPPKISPVQVKIIPIQRVGYEVAVNVAADKLKQQLSALSWEGELLRVQIDSSDYASADKRWRHIKSGIPLVIELGPRDLEEHTCSVTNRLELSKKSQILPQEELIESIKMMLSQQQEQLLQRSQNRLKERTKICASLRELEVALEDPDAGFFQVYLSDEQALADFLSDNQLSVRCILNDAAAQGPCIATHEMTDQVVIIAKAY